MSPTCPLVSLVTPSLNHGRFIERAILSVLTQDYTPIEYLVVDGGSTDGTLAVLGKYSDRLQWTSEPDLGLYDAVNRGWARCHGTYLGYLNCDDELCAGAIRYMVDGLQQDPSVVLVYGDYFRIDETGMILELVRAGRADFGTLVRKGNTIFTGGMMLRRSLLEDVGWFDCRLVYAADYDFVVRVAQAHPIVHLDRPLAMFRMHVDSKSQNAKWAMWREALQVSHGYSGRRSFSLYSRYCIDKTAHILGRPLVWYRFLVPVRKTLRRLWHLGN
jgi:glycosyltransferase involved in cell wall biosynthesis